MTVTPNTESQVPGDEASGLATAQLLQQQAAAQPAPAEEAPADAHEEDAIAAYMAELLQRHNPDGAPPAAAPVPQATPEPEAAVPAEPVPEPEKPRVPVAPPERRDDLAVMRELANSNAKNALDAYSSARMVKTTKGRFQIAAVAVVLSFALAYFSPGVTSLAFVGSVACLAIAILWTSRYLLLVKHLKTSLERPVTRPQPEPVQPPNVAQAEAAATE